jgi:hypothetical protein
MPEEQIQRDIYAAKKKKDVGCLKPFHDKSWAVIIGINDYMNGRASLVNACNDATAFAERQCISKSNSIQDSHKK